jgi:hypothetical protein
MITAPTVKYDSRPNTRIATYDCNPKRALVRSAGVPYLATLIDANRGQTGPSQQEGPSTVRKDQEKRRRSWF